jgi:hypothetical protein
MRLTAAFFANHGEIVDGMLNVEGAFWKTTTVPPGSAGFQCCSVVLCEMNSDDLGEQYSLHIDAEGPSGHRLAPAHSTDFTVEGQSLFMCFPSLVLPIDPGGGRHLYTFRIAGQHERVDVPLAVRVKRA